MRMLANRRGTSLIMYAALVGLVLAVAVTMRLTVQQAIQAKIASSTVDLLRIPEDTGDGHATQEFGGSATEELQGFLNDPGLIATGNTSKNASTSGYFTGGVYGADTVITDERNSVQVTRELLPTLGGTAPTAPPTDSIPTKPHGPVMRTD